MASSEITECRFCGLSFLSYQIDLTTTLEALNKCEEVCSKLSEKLSAALKEIEVFKSRENEFNSELDRLSDVVRRYEEEFISKDAKIKELMTQSTSSKAVTNTKESIASSGIKDTKAKNVSTDSTGIKASKSDIKTVDLEKEKLKGQTSIKKDKSSIASESSSKKAKHSKRSRSPTITPKSSPEIDRSYSRHRTESRDYPPSRRRSGSRHRTRSPSSSYRPRPRSPPRGTEDRGFKRRPSSSNHRPRSTSQHRGDQELIPEWQSTVNNMKQLIHAHQITLKLFNGNDILDPDRALQKDLVWLTEPKLMSRTNYELFNEMQIIVDSVGSVIEKRPKFYLAERMDYAEFKLNVEAMLRHSLGLNMSPSQVERVPKFTQQLKAGKAALPPLTNKQRQTVYKMSQVIPGIIQSFALVADFAYLGISELITSFMEYFIHINNKLHGPFDSDLHFKRSAIEPLDKLEDYMKNFAQNCRANKIVYRDQTGDILDRVQRKIAQIRHFTETLMNGTLNDAKSG
ncbi:hypothetical protein HDE_12248 [Halotydeus destructor]|nr:hypothetical protein HDE_12248 [Halotydeus destructor]